MKKELIAAIEARLTSNLKGEDYYGLSQQQGALVGGAVVRRRSEPLSAGHLRQLPRPPRPAEPAACGDKAGRPGRAALNEADHIDR